MSMSPSMFFFFYFSPLNLNLYSKFSFCLTKMLPSFKLLVDSLVVILVVKNPPSFTSLLIRKWSVMEKVLA